MRTTKRGEQLEENTKRCSWQKWEGRGEKEECKTFENGVKPNSIGIIIYREEDGEWHIPKRHLNSKLDSGLKWSKG